MSDRALVHVEKIIAIDPIPGADKIEVATVLGWQCVVTKGKFKVGDLGCYIEVDSIVPPIPYFLFMEPRRYRVKTIKLRKQISQGLLLSYDEVIECQNQIVKAIKNNTGTNVSFKNKWEEGKDFTILLAVVKYLSPSERESDREEIPRKKHNFFTRFMTRFNWYRRLTKSRSKSFPEWIAKTDETRIQNMPSLLRSDKLFYRTEKLDGQSATFWYRVLFKFLFWLIEDFGICSRTVRKFESGTSNWAEVARKFDIKNKLKELNKFYGSVFAIQGEIIGPGIQGNKYKLSELDFYVFNVYDKNNKKKIDRVLAQEMCARMGLKYVPVLAVNVPIFSTMEDMIKSSVGKSTLKDIQKEGDVWRMDDQSISFKVINPEFLLGEKDEESK